MLVRVRVAVPGEPDSTTRLVVLEDMAKSITLTVMMAVWEGVPPTAVAVTVTVYVAVETALPTVIVRTELTGPVGLTETVVGLSEDCGPSGFTAADTATLPVKLFTLVRVTVAVVDEPTGMFTETGLATIVKSGIGPTETLTVVGREEVPMEAVTVIVYEPVGVFVVEESTKVELAEPPGESVTLCGFSETTRPLLEAT